MTRFDGAVPQASLSPSRRLASSRRITVTMPEKVFGLLVDRSNQEGRSVSNLVAFLIERALAPQDHPRF